MCRQPSERRPLPCRGSTAPHFGDGFPNDRAVKLQGREGCSCACLHIPARPLAEPDALDHHRSYQKGPDHPGLDMSVMFKSAMPLRRFSPIRMASSVPAGGPEPPKMLTPPRTAPTRTAYSSPAKAAGVDAGELGRVAVRADHIGLATETRPLQHHMDQREGDQRKRHRAVQAILPQRVEPAGEIVDAAVLDHHAGKAAKADQRHHRRHDDLADLRCRAGGVSDTLPDVQQPVFTAMMALPGLRAACPACGHAVR